MTTKLATLTIALLALGFLAAPAGAQSSSASPSVGIRNPTNAAHELLYFHIVDALNDMPINTQPPAEGYQKDANVGTATFSSTCVPPTPAGSATSQSFNDYYGYSSPGYVEYNSTQPDGKPLTHPERGLSYDIEFAGDHLTMYWYLSTTLGTPPTQLPVSPDEYVVLPHVAVHAWVKTGESVSIGDSGYKTGNLIAEGETVGDLGRDLATKTESSTGEVHYYPETQNGQNLAVYEYKIDLPLAMKLIPKSGGYNVHIAVFLKDQGTAGCTDPENKILMPNNVKIHTSASHRPRLEADVLNAVRIEYMHPQFIGDDLVIHTSSNSPFGNYDVQEKPEAGTNGMKGGIELSITGPSEARSAYRAAVVQRYHVHNHHTEAVDVTFVWPYKADGALDGTYTIKLSVTNDQENAIATGITTFALGKTNSAVGCGGLDSVDTAKTDGGCFTATGTQDGGAKASPHLELAGVLGALGAVAALLRRRLL